MDSLFGGRTNSVFRSIANNNSTRATPPTGLVKKMSSIIVPAVANEMAGLSPNHNNGHVCNNINQSFSVVFGSSQAPRMNSIKND